MTEIIDGKEFVKIKAKIEIAPIYLDASESLIWLDKEDLLNSIHPKCKPILCVGIPNETNEELELVRKHAAIEFKEYHVIVFNAKEVNFQVFNADNLQPTDLDTIKKYITDLTH